MPSNLKKIAFDYEAMQMKELFFDETYQCKQMGASTLGIQKVFNRDFYFDDLYEDRPYVFNSLVTSIDGKIAFEDAPQGPLIARNNKFAKAGANLDYWILNILRGSADAIFTGTGSINAEVKTGGSGHCYDEQIECFRESQGIAAVPLGIVVSIDGTDINYNAAIFKTDEKPIVFYTTEVGYQNIANNQERTVVCIREVADAIPINQLDTNIVYTVVSGEQQFNHKKGLSILKHMKINRLLVESPTVTHVFMKEKIMDELFLNYSCLYIGGKAPSIGYSLDSFTSVDHPHTKLISIHMYNPHFLYFRHKLVYND